MNIYNDTSLTQTLTSGDLITSSYFKDLINNPFKTLEGAYITYQITNLNIFKGSSGPDVDVTDPALNDFYFNTENQTEYKYSGTDWIELTSSMLDIIVETGFSSSWIPVTTIKRAGFIELTIPKDYLPINIDESLNIFIGFKDIVDSSKIVSAIGMPLELSNTRFFSREVNTSISFPIDFKCGFLNLITDTNINKLENPEIDNELTPNIGTLLAEYKSYSSDNSSVGAGNISGTSLIF